MTTSSELKEKLKASREYREEFVAAMVKRAFPVQVRTLRKLREMSQGELAEEANVTQGVVSRAEDPNYGNLTFNTALRMAAGLDLAFIPKLVTFDEFLRWVESVSDGFRNLPTFEPGNVIVPAHARFGLVAFEANTTKQNDPRLAKTASAADVLNKTSQALGR